MVTAVLWVSGVFFVLQLILLTGIAINKNRSIRLEGRKQQAYRQALGPYIVYLSGESDVQPRLPKDKSIKIFIIEKLLSGYSQNVNSEAEKERMKMTADEHLQSHYMQVLRKGSWSERVNVLYFMEDFMMTSLKDQVWEHIQAVPERDEEYRQSMRVLASFGDERVLPFMIYDQSLSIGFTKELLRRFPAAFIDRLKTTESLPSGVLTAMLSYFGETGFYEHLPFVEANLNSEDKEIRLKALAALTQYRYYSDHDSLERFITSSLWEERMYGARLAGLLNLSRYSPQLMELAGDGNWWVRFAACEALKRLPDGEILLEFAAEEHQDPYARDMAKQLRTLRTGVTA
ncbi:HEAT repeat domain-containing protein [Jeotgalibacillus sp. R-1-5s-1]|uniref:HEAT repeat domain-containing protein n=1 Tax=Jeotgalibacillus sp. R-1-5s-1 TaxID=2555897 RepID=UPI00106B87D6|nr:HEAT repeat domain-containing protein [Jeotgalibacillus sp. R-1-5s-1]TFE00074.1 HEAT repeat domain-containing protein [Jeotgalibacillus sp. R-1-5s-1]